MKIKYYPGCTIKTHGQHFEISTRAVLGELGVELEEIERWTCCGTVYSLTSDDLIHHLAPIRNLLRVKQQGGEKVLTLCSMCYNTLKRADLLVQANEEKKDKIKDFMYKEIVGYEGGVTVVHLLELLQSIGYEKIKEKIKRPLNGISVAPYYGCMLLRPEEIAIDNYEEPSIFEDIISLTGAKVVNFPYRNECCGSYQTLRRPEVIIERANRIISSARDNGADMILLSCPLCSFNLETKQKDVADVHFGFHGIPVIYFSQLLAFAFGFNSDKVRFDLNEIDPTPIFERVEKAIKR